MEMMKRTTRMILTVAVVLILCAGFVTALVVSSNSMTVNQRVNPEPTINLIGPTSVSDVYAGQSATYDFTANVPVTVNSAYAIMSLTKSGGISPSDVSNVTFTFDGVSMQVSLGANGGGLMTTVNLNAVSQGTHNGSLTITYDTAGDYILTVTMSGNF